MSRDKYEWLVRTEINFADSLWTLTSCDLPGLLLAHEDINTLLDDVPDAIKLLVELNYGVKLDRVVPVSPAVDMAAQQRSFTPPSGFTALRLAA